MEPTDGKVIEEIEDFLHKRRTTGDIRSPRCRYCLPFSFRCPEGWNTCTNEKTEKSDRLKCTFLDYQPDCLYYEPDPDYPLFIQFEQLEEEAKRLKSQFEASGQGEILKKAIKVTKDLLELLKKRRDLFGGWAYLHYQFQLMNLERQLPEKQLSWYRRMVTKLVP